MSWLLQTDETRADGVFSTLYQNSEKFLVTLEHAYEAADGYYFPKLPRGATYKCVRGTHSLDHYNGGRPFEAFEVTGVANHTGILLHVGNFNENSDGCILVGENVHRENSKWWIDDSRVAFSRFMTIMIGIDEFDLEVQ